MQISIAQLVFFFRIATSSNEQIDVTYLEMSQFTWTHLKGKWTNIPAEKIKWEAYN